jgi:hypothetical protein
MLPNRLVLAPEEECFDVRDVNDMRQPKPRFVGIVRDFLLRKRTAEHQTQAEAQLLVVQVNLRHERTTDEVPKPRAPGNRPPALVASVSSGVAQALPLWSGEHCVKLQTEPNWPREACQLQRFVRRPSGEAEHLPQVMRNARVATDHQR